MNLERLLDLAIEAKNINPGAIDEIISMTKKELEANIAKQSGKKDTYNAILKYIKHVHKYYDGTRENMENILQNKNGKYYLTDGFSAIEFSNLDPKDIVVAENTLSGACFDIIEAIFGRNKTDVIIPSEKDILFLYKTQLAEQKNNNDYTVYIKIGNSYYNPDFLLKTLSLMGKEIKAWYCSEKKDSELSMSDEDGNRSVLMPLRSSAINIRED